jgi:hypothetical protein
VIAVRPTLVVTRSTRSLAADEFVLRWVQTYRPLTVTLVHQEQPGSSFSHQGHYFALIQIAPQDSNQALIAHCDRPDLIGLRHFIALGP